MSGRLHPRVAVIGAGANGLASALAMQKRGFHVTIIAEKFSPRTTSDGAGVAGFEAGLKQALVRPVYLAETPEEKVVSWNAETMRFLDAVVREGHGREAGVAHCSGYELFGYEEPTPGWKDSVFGFRFCERDEIERVFGPDIASRTMSAFFYTSFMVEGPRFLPWMLRQLEEGGANVFEGRVERLDDLYQPAAARSAPLQVRRLHGLEDLSAAFDVVVNCTGLVGGATAGDDHQGYPARGQTVYLHAPWQKLFVMAESLFWKGSINYVFPRFDKVVVGGTYQKGDTDTNTRASDTECMLSEAIRLQPSLRTAKMVGSWTGLRPCRPAVRLESAVVGENRLLVHNYGHGGSGLSLFTGCGEEVARTVAAFAGRTPSSL